MLGHQDERQQAEVMPTGCPLDRGTELRAPLVVGEQGHPPVAGARQLVHMPGLIEVPNPFSMRLRHGPHDTMPADVALRKVWIDDSMPTILLSANDEPRGRALLVADALRRISHLPLSESLQIVNSLFEGLHDSSNPVKVEVTVESEDPRFVLFADECEKCGIAIA